MKASMQLAFVAAFSAAAVAGFTNIPSISHAAGKSDRPSLMMPKMDPDQGKRLFASKGCVVCHSVNGVGGTDAPKLDASTMTPQMNPFEFFAKMWRGAAPMIAMQENEIGHQIEFTGQDLADIVAFVHDAGVQKTFTAGDIPADIKEHMEGDEENKGEGHKMGAAMMGGHDKEKKAHAN